MAGVQNIEVTAGEAGQKLLQFLERRAGAPRALIHKWIRSGQVRVDGKRAGPYDRLDQGASVRVPPHQPAAEGARPAAGAVARPGLPVLYEGRGLLVIDKPSGLAAQPGSGLTDSVADRLKALYADRDFLPSLAHRLDRDTSGLLLCATTYERLRELNDLFKEKGEGLRKIYLAWARGRMAPSGRLAMRDRLEKRGLAGREKVEVGAGKEARAVALPLAWREDATLVAVRLITGRMHQIRAQLSSRGHAIVGDGKYGGGRAPRLLLHAWRLELPWLCLESPPAWPAPWSLADAERAALAKADRL